MASSGLHSSSTTSTWGPVRPPLLSPFPSQSLLSGKLGPSPHLSRNNSPLAAAEDYELYANIVYPISLISLVFMWFLLLLPVFKKVRGLLSPLLILCLSWSIVCLQHPPLYVSFILFKHSWKRSPSEPSASSSWCPWTSSSRCPPSKISSCTARRSLCDPHPPFFHAPSLSMWPSSPVRTPAGGRQGAHRGSQEQRETHAAHPGRGLCGPPAVQPQNDHHGIQQGGVSVLSGGQFSRRSLVLKPLPHLSCSFPGPQDVPAARVLRPGKLFLEPLLPGRPVHSISF